MRIWPLHPHEIEWVNHPAKFDDVVYKRGLCGWVLPLHIAEKILKYNPRHLPVIQRRPDNEDVYIRLSIRRILNGYRVYGTLTEQCQAILGKTSP